MVDAKEAGIGEWLVSWHGTASRGALSFGDDPAMNRLALALIGILAGFSTGCSMCCGPMDYAYPTYGGKWERADRFHGRVGSVFYDASAGQVTDEVVMEGEAAEGEVVEEEVIIEQ